MEDSIISKMISVVTNSLYILIVLVIIAIFLGNNHILIIFLLICFSIFVFRYSKKLLIILIIISFLFIIDYKLQYQKLFIKVDENIVCTIYSIPKYDGRIQFYCKSDKMKILVYIQDIEAEVRLGDVVSLEANLNLVKHNTVPNQFDYANYLYAKHITYQNNSKTIKIIDKSQRIDYRIINSIQDYYQTSPISGYLLSFLIGDDNYFTASFTDNTQMLNISHLLVVSGFQVGFLYLIIHFVLKYLRITKETGEVISILFLLLFLIINLFSVSILRAVCLIIGIRIKNKFHLPIDNIHILSFIACINIIINPFILSNSGFVLSYLITLVLFLSRSLLRNQSNYILTLYKVNIICQLFSLPIIANFSFFYNFLSVIFVPILGLYYTFIIFPFTLFCLIFKDLAHYLQWFFHFYDYLIEYLSSISLLYYNIGVFDSMRYILYFFVLLMFIKKLEVGRFSYVSLSILMIIMLFYHKFSFADEVTFIDVGQGDSIFISQKIPKCNMLIDTGGNSNYHPGQNIVKYFHSIQLKKIDYLFITHTDIDHAGDYKLILDNFKVKNIVFNLYDESELQKEIERDAKNKNINILKLNAYNNVECGNIPIFILNPMIKNNTSNDNSLVLFFLFNGDNYLLMGDANSQDIKKINETEIDFLKISHHGSKYQTNASLFNHYRVKNAIISVGNNHYGHPSKEVINLLKSNNVAYFRTDLDGTISVKYYLGKIRMRYLFKPHNIITPVFGAH